MTVTGLVCFGDSILAGLGASERANACAKLLKETLKVQILLKGRNSDTSRDAIARIHKDVLDHNDLSHVLILFGNNDSWPDKQGNSAIALPEFKENLKKIIDLIVRNHQNPILVNLQPIDNEKFYKKFKEYVELKNRGENPSLWQKKYSDVIDSVAKNLGVPLIDIRSPMEKACVSPMSEDGIHPNDEGHKIIYQALLGYFLKIAPDIACI